MGDRRRFLKGAVSSLSIPLLASLPGAVGAGRASSGSGVKRLVCVGTQLGFYPREFFAKQGATRLTMPLENAGLSGQYTTLSGLDHAGPSARGHELVHTLYTGQAAPHTSLDQYVAPRLGADTRYASLQVCCGRSNQRASLSFNQAGIPLPAILRPSVLYARLFGDASAGLEWQSYVLDSGMSMLDELVDDAKSVASRASAGDAQRLDEYLTSVREAEEQLLRERDWLDRPYPPKPALKLPEEDRIDGSRMLETESLMWDLLALALVTDSTRVISLTIPITDQAIRIDGKPTSQGYHTLSHHGNRPSKVSELLKIEEGHMQGAARFLAALKKSPDGTGTLLDSTITLIGSAMGDASRHHRRNFPLLVAGGQLKHKRHISCGTSSVPNKRACDLFVTVLHRLGIEDRGFSTSTSDLDSQLA